MAFIMAHPTKHPLTGMFYYRGRVPADLVKQLKGRSISVDVGETPSLVRLGSHCKVSLQTKDVQTAKTRNAQVETQLGTLWEAERRGATHLTFEQVCALAGEMRRETLAANEAEPGSPADWDFLQGQLSDALSWFERDEDGTPLNPKQGEWEVSRLIQVDGFLQARGLGLTPQSYRQFVEQAGGALWRAYDTLSRRALGDYSPDEHAARYPIWRDSDGRSTEAAAVPLLDLFGRWAAEAKPVAATVDGWRPYLQGFIGLTGHDDAMRFTSHDVARWKDALVQRGDSAKTINGSKLAALKTVLQWGVDNHRLTENVASRVRVRQKVRAGERMRGFSLDEAAAIFRAAEKQTSKVYRWVPALCALSGARVAEVCQLRAEDVRRELGFWVMQFAPEAGSLKTVSSERLVPLHPYLLEHGFLKFVESVGSGPLFYDEKRRNPGAKKPPAKIVAKNVAAWVHKRDLGVGRAQRKDPNHAWRHYFITVLRDLEINDSVIERLTGHGASNVNKGYGEAMLRTLSRAIDSVPIPAGQAQSPMTAAEGAGR
ncbi:DUF6538 domain-containing protein [Bradyrhizobium mercantei]|uniref:DUF6538 domain-containing protein n=1 Tax=Bradyrhizobium mercantei TaxID=1904807 RepID=UPI0009F9040A|nr:DUF6538 domain-containing protein [Bradyrhizobium mercantei]